MKVKIINGTYGMFVDGLVERKTELDPPFEVSDDEAKKLVELKVARIVEEKTEDTAEEKADFRENKPIDQCSFKELQTMASEKGIDVSNLKSKKSIIDSLTADQEEEKAPEIGVADVVE